MKILKILAVLVLSFVLLVVVLIGLLFYVMAKMPAVPTNYTEKVETGGVLEAKYIKQGSYGVECMTAPLSEEWGNLIVHYPKELSSSEKKYPVVLLMNGTGVPASKYPALFTHLASWGFVVLGNEDPSTCTGASADSTLAFIIRENEEAESPFYQKIDLENIGIAGHSQGGAGVFNAITRYERSGLYKTAVALSPTHESVAKQIPGFEYDVTKVKVPLMLVAGDTGDFETKMVIPLEELVAMYERLSVPKVMMRRKGSEHGQTLYVADGYVTAWLMWHLQHDEEAANAFVGEKPELIHNSLYSDWRIDYPWSQ